VLGSSPVLPGNGARHKKCSNCGLSALDFRFVLRSRGTAGRLEEVEHEAARATAANRRKAATKDRGLNAKVGRASEQLAADTLRKEVRPGDGYIPR
jgi:hypothetical protein